MRRLAAILLTLVSAQAMAHGNHCKGAEKTLFSCLVSKKVVSVCASQNLSPREGYMQLRFGRLQAPELLIPQLNEHPLKHVDAEAYQAASGQNGALTFAKGEHTYTVYWESYRSDRPAPNGSSVWLEMSGLSISHKGKVVSDTKCSKATNGDILTIEPFYLHLQVGYPEK